MLRLRETGQEGLGKGLAAGLRLAATPLRPSVLAEVGPTMPKGYEETLSRSLTFRTTVRSFKYTARVTWRVYGDGRDERRDVPALNRGTLRHPVYGRTRRVRRHSVYRATSIPNPWVSQQVKAGFVDRPLRQLGPAVRREMDKVIDQVAAKITRS